MDALYQLHIFSSDTFPLSLVKMQVSANNEHLIFYMPLEVCNAICFISEINKMRCSLMLVQHCTYSA